MKVLLAAAVLVVSTAMIGCEDNKNGHVDRYRKKYTDAHLVQPAPIPTLTDKQV